MPRLLVRYSSPTHPSSSLDSLSQRRYAGLGVTKSTIGHSLTRVLASEEPNLTLPSILHHLKTQRFPRKPILTPPLAGLFLKPFSLSQSHPSTMDPRLTFPYYSLATPLSDFWPLLCGLSSTCDCGLFTSPAPELVPPPKTEPALSCPPLSHTHRSLASLLRFSSITPPLPPGPQGSGRQQWAELLGLAAGVREQAALALP